jgi:hypothetical protein
MEARVLGKVPLHHLAVAAAAVLRVIRNNPMVHLKTTMVKEVEISKARLPQIKIRILLTS